MHNVETLPKSDEIDTTLKYQHLIDADTSIDCPCPDKCSPMDGQAYRFSITSEVTPEQFLPTFLVDQARKKKRKVQGAHKCLKYACSLYNTEDNAINSYNFLSEKFLENWPHRFILIGLITRTDGLASDPDITGHFSFFEFRSANIFRTFRSLTQLR
jgi:hypothetical protein